MTSVVLDFQHPKIGLTDPQKLIVTINNKVMKLYCNLLKERIQNVSVKTVAMETSVVVALVGHFVFNEETAIRNTRLDTEL